MSKRQEDLDDGIAKMLAHNDPDSVVITKVKLGLWRPVWPASTADLNLVELANDLATQLGQPFRHESSGGGSDGISLAQWVFRRLTVLGLLATNIIRLKNISKLIVWQCAAG